MKTIFLLLILILQFSLLAQAGRESHGIVENFDIRCFNKSGTGSKVFVNLNEKPKYARYTDTNNHSSELDCKGTSTLICSDKSSEITVQVNRKSKPMTAVILENRREIEKIPCN